MNEVVAGKSRIRWMMMGMVFLIVVVNYLDRANIGVAEPLITSALHFSPLQMGVIFSATVWGLFLGELPGGIMASVWGPRKLYTFALIGWSIFMVLPLLTTSFTGWMWIRVGFGFFEGMTWGIASMVGVRWFPTKERGKAMALQNMGLAVGSAIGAPLITLLMLVLSWQWAFVIIAALGIIMALVWWNLASDFPTDSTKVNHAELEYIIQGQEKVEDQGQKPAVLKTLQYVVKKPSLWALVVANWTLAYFLFTLTSWLPAYLHTARGLSLPKTGLVAALPWILAAISIPFSGWLTDHLLARYGSYRWARAIPTSGGLFVGGILLFPAISVHSVALGVALLSISFAFVLMQLGPVWTIPTDVGGTFGAGIAAGFANTLIQTGGIIAPLLMGYLVQTTNSYSLGFEITGAIVFVSGILFPILYRGPIDFHEGHPARIALSIDTPTSISRS
ncbi:MFS transporter [Sulfoacidibacillus ferrooxidans]|uniref:Sulfoacetate transporter SauU n=1 Tax=Sulfoacidibacillus ferrooxidans TaxID=2005001 RepID=A0A9X2ABB9_9BACL|nr:MFS transporter [Sulfoacidibacillus ferrooxidans]MCI0182544.1 putative sulfoacetate transporter SauU [Sulfoacidibacillus ferrooxidans]